jgi:hypothetical protein
VSAQPSRVPEQQKLGRVRAFVQLAEPRRRCRKRFTKASPSRE